MSYIVAEPCIKCKYTDCVSVCPVNCFYEGENFLVINPDECIDCGACVPECPSEAIFSEDDLPAKWAEYKKKNVDLSKAWPNINTKKTPPADAEQWKDVADKGQYLSLKPGTGT